MIACTLSAPDTKGSFMHASETDEANEAYRKAEEMTTVKSLTIAILVTVLAIGSSVPVRAQNAPDSHHPSDAGAAQPGTAVPQLPAQNGQPGMMGMMPMMQMMNMMGQGGMAMPGMGMSGMDPAGMAMVDRVEGRIAFLRAELKITDAQAQAWDVFAAALRDNAKRLGEVRATIGGQAASPSGLGQRLANQELWLSARLDGIRAIKAAFVPLYSALATDQQKTADELLGMHMGLMHPGMMPMGMMQMGGATP